MKFHITWPTGLAEIITSECEHVDALAMEMWGRESAEIVKLEHRVLIALHVEDARAVADTASPYAQAVMDEMTAATEQSPAVALAEFHEAEAAKFHATQQAEGVAAAASEPESEPAPDAPAVTSESGEAPAEGA